MQLAVGHVQPCPSRNRSVDRCIGLTDGLTKALGSQSLATSWHPVFHPGQCVSVFDATPPHAYGRVRSHAAHASSSQASTSAGDTMASEPLATSAPSATGTPAVDLEEREARKLTRLGTDW